MKMVLAHRLKYGLEQQTEWSELSYLSVLKALITPGIPNPLHGFHFSLPAGRNPHQLSNNPRLLQAK